MTRIVIDMIEGYSWGAEDGGYGDGASIEDCGEVALNIGDVTIKLSYPQFERFLDNVLRWRWNWPPENPTPLLQDMPPPSWELLVRHVQEQVESERGTIKQVLEHRAQDHGNIPQPADDKLPIRHRMAGHSQGVKEGLLLAVKLIEERREKYDMLPKPDPEPKKKKKQMRNVFPGERY